jgi:hypothetical protein
VALAAGDQLGVGAVQHQYDSDSFLIAVDNCCSKSITNQMADFIGQPEKVFIEVRGIGRKVNATWKGTVRWKIEDNDGQVHTIELPGTYYHGESPYRLISPQHRSQVAKDNHRTHQVSPRISKVPRVLPRGRRT